MGDVERGINGPCYRIVAVADGLLCGLVGKLVARLEENCKRLSGDEFDRAGVAWRDII